jgi:dihydroorotate dehydrogenase (NAD+) catalytic subunit
MIELAFGHKLGLSVTSPVLLAGGAIGLGDAMPPGLDLAQLGAVVLGPLRRQPSAGAPPPRMAEAPGLAIIADGLQNRGLSAALKRYARQWSRMACPVVVQLADTELRALAAVAGQIATIENVAGFELLAPSAVAGRGSVAQWLTQAVRVLAQESDLPVWVKLPLAQAVPLGHAAVEAGAAALVVGQPPIGTLPYAPTDGLTSLAAESTLISGPLYGPTVFPLVMTTLIELAHQALPTLLIGCGGIHTVTQAHQLLAAGATAIQLDSALWIEPGLPQQLAQALRSTV